MALTPKDPLRQELLDIPKREPALKASLEEGDVALDTHHLERGLRSIPMDRQNGLFCWKEVGAERAGMIQSLITTGEWYDIDTIVYLVDVLQWVSEHSVLKAKMLTPR